MTDAERIRELEAENERLRKLADPCGMDEVEEVFWQRVEEQYP